MNLLDKSLLIIFSISFIFLGGCSSSKNTAGHNQYYKNLDKEFSDAYSTFKDKNYTLAKEEFIEYNKLDTSEHNFDSFAFLAECYKQLGDLDSGKVCYEEGIKKLEESENKLKNIIGDDEFFCDTLKNWFNNYPAFPNSLRSENGFVPYDVLPKVVHLEPPTYPVEAKAKNLQGTVFVDILINRKGQPMKAVVVKSDNSIFNDPSITAAMNSKFTPLKRKGHLQKCWIVVPFKYALGN